MGHDRWWDVCRILVWDDWKAEKKHVRTTLSRFFLQIHVEAAHNICHYSNLTVVAAKEAKKIDYLVSGKIVQMTSLCKKGEIKGESVWPMWRQKKRMGSKPHTQIQISSHSCLLTADNRKGMFPSLKTCTDSRTLKDRLISLPVSLSISVTLVFWVREEQRLCISTCLSRSDVEEPTPCLMIMIMVMTAMARAGLNWLAAR